MQDRQHKPTAAAQTHEHQSPDTQSQPQSQTAILQYQHLHPRQVLQLQRQIGNRAVQRLMRAQKPPRIQRFQAGETGHGGIEREALGDLFSSDEIGQVYFGNWMRDFSQFPTVNSLPEFLDPVLQVVSIVSMGEFNRPTTRAELGGYVASEHMDNPEGGGTVEDPEVRADPARLAEALSHLSPAQREEYERNEAARAEITAASAASHLPEYIERSKLHAKNKLREAAAAEDEAEGRRLMGDALHAVEDYFAHSNFADAAVWLLHNEGDARATFLSGRLTEHLHGVNPALVGNTPDDSSEHPRIVTGTYATTSDTIVSLLEQFKTEIEHGQLSRGFILGLVRMGQIGAAALSEIVCGIPGGVAGAVDGIIPGAVEGASEGYERGSISGYSSGYARGSALHPIVGMAMGEVESVVGGVTEGVSGFFGGAVEGAERGYTEGSESAAAECTAIANGVISEEGWTALQNSALIRGYLSRYTGLLETAAELYTSESASEAAEAGLHGPTHSQIAKDSPDHLLYQMARALAVEADRAITTVMHEAWEAPAGSARTEAGERAAALVDEYISDPSLNNWWRSTVTASLSHP
ncbi:MAG: HET-C-related protein [Anaerolineae bacterium]